jgi:hypothetical protein
MKANRAGRWRPAVTAATVVAANLAAIVALAMIVAMIVALMPASAWACSACATRSGYGSATALLIAGLIAAPYAVAAVALKIIRRLDKEPS